MIQQPQPMRDEAVPEGSMTAAQKAATHPPSAKIPFTKIVLLQEQPKTRSTEGTEADEVCLLCTRHGSNSSYRETVTDRRTV
jgi:hypothetical protein